MKLLQFKNDLTFRQKAVWFRKTDMSPVVRDFGQENQDVREIVRCPKSEEINEWLAINCVDFFNQTNLIYGNLMNVCKCSTMNAGQKYLYMWADGESVVKPIKCTAPQYMSYLMAWIQSKLDDPSIFPRKADQEFGANFHATVQNIFKRLMRVYSHVYYHHFKDLESMQADSYLNTSFKHFVYFVREFDLVSDKEMKPLQVLIDSILQAENKKQLECQKQANDPDLQTQTERYSPEPSQFEQKVKSKASLDSIPEGRSLFGSKAPSSVASKASTDFKSDIRSFSASTQRSHSNKSENIEALEVSTEDVSNDKPEVVSRQDTFEPPPRYNTMDVILDSYSIAPPPPLLASRKGSKPELPTILSRSSSINAGTISQPVSRTASEDLVVPDTPPNQSALACPLDEGPPVTLLPLSGERGTRQSSLSKAPRRSMYFSGLTISKDQSMGYYTVSTDGDTDDYALDRYQPDVAILGTCFDAELAVQSYRAAGYNVHTSYSVDGSETWAQQQGITCVAQTLAEVVEDESIKTIFVGQDSLGRTGSEVSQNWQLLLQRRSACVLAASPLALPLPFRRHIGSLDQASTSAIFATNCTQHPLRFMPNCRRVKETILEDNLCGKVCHMALSLQTNWKQELEDCFDETNNLTLMCRLESLMSLVQAHLIDLVCWMLDGDQVVSIHTQLHSLTDDSRDMVVITLKTVSKVSVVINVSFVNQFVPVSFRLEVTGSHGQINLSDNKVYFTQASKQVGTKPTPKIMMEDHSPETLFSMPLHLLGSASLHMLRSLKLQIYQQSLDKELSPNQKVLAAKSLETLCPLTTGFLNMRVLECIKRQDLLDTAYVFQISELLKQSPKAIKARKSHSSNLATEITPQRTQQPTPPPRTKKRAISTKQND